MYSSTGGYGQLSQKDERNRKIFLNFFFILFVICMVVLLISNPLHRNPPPPQPDSTELSDYSKAIKSICEPTDYKQTCMDTLSAAAGSDSSNPMELVRIYFKVMKDKLHQVLNHSEVLKTLYKESRTSRALKNCNELIGYAVDDLESSLNNLGDVDIANIRWTVQNLSMWLSASLTYQETCLDGFENTTGNAPAAMRTAMTSSAELTSNALVIIKQISTFLTDFKLSLVNRRLLSENEEELSEHLDTLKWVSDGRRRLLAASVAEMKPEMVVAKDGSGHYKTINEALAAVPKKRNSAFVIYIKEGVYKEIVHINRTMKNLVMIGDGPTKTRITGNLNFFDGTPTFKTATVAVMGDGFIGKNLGIENSAGPEKSQAVALLVQSDRSIFYNCNIDGYQDTLYVHTYRQFYRECTISGTIDFIVGNAAAVFQNCIMLVRKPMDHQKNTVTAQGRKDRREPTGIVLHNCTITADPEYYPHRTKLPTYLGRPQKEYSRTLILQSRLDDLVHPFGWSAPSTGDFGLKACYYAEFGNRGPGAEAARRVSWKNITYEHARQFSVCRFIQGNRWINSSGIPYTPGLPPVNTTKPLTTGLTTVPRKPTADRG